MSSWSNRKLRGDEVGCSFGSYRQKNPGIGGVYGGYEEEKAGLGPGCAHLEGPARMMRISMLGTSELCVGFCRLCSSVDFLDLWPWACSGVSYRPLCSSWDENEHLQCWGHGALQGNCELVGGELLPQEKWYCISGSQDWENGVWDSNAGIVEDHCGKDGATLEGKTLNLTVNQHFNF